MKGFVKINLVFLKPGRTQANVKDENDVFVEDEYIRLDEIIAIAPWNEFSTIPMSKSFIILRGQHFHTTHEFEDLAQIIDEAISTITK